MKKSIVLFALVSVAAVTAFAAPKIKKSGADGGATVATGKDGDVEITQVCRISNQNMQSAPSIGQSALGVVFKKPRRWIVLELKYDTAAKWQDELTVTWHVLLDITKATENKGALKAPVKPGEKPPAQYSYFNTSVTYQNIPQGSHAASVCLPPSYLERYGEPVVVAAIITNKDGDILTGQNEGAAQVFKSMAAKWWENDKVLGAQDKNGNPMIERRQGMVDRSKTIFALVDPNNYEVVRQ